VSCDADTLYPSTWLRELVKPLQAKQTISTTYSLHCQLDEQGRYDFSFYLYQYAKHLFYYMRAAKRGQLNCGGASMAFRRQEAIQIGGYNTALQRGEDGLLALQLSSFGSIKMVSTKKAFIYTSNRRTLQDGSLNQAFVKRALKGLRNSLSFLTTQKIPTS
jgi:cellulose synthase/poly-beta-1,6-N-acetylglucosamine synthase-like glycosyltransferase